MEIASAYWAAHLGLSVSQLFIRELTITSHGAELSDYAGVFALFREGAAIVSLPDRADFLRSLISTLVGFCPETMADALRPYAAKVIGPAYIGYAEDVPAPAHAARAIMNGDTAAVTALEAACPEEEWEHGGVNSPTRSASGVFCDNHLVALASYEIWGDSIAHISIITHPKYRSRGFGSSAVAHIAARALADGLLPQYRTLESNVPSMRIAKALGFTKYASSLAVRLKG